MAIPKVNAFINFSTGPSFGQAFIIGSGIFGTNILADSTAVIVDVSSQVDSITTSRGRNAIADQFFTGTLTLRLVDQNGDFNPQNTSGPYYNLLSPMRKVQITATYNSVTYPIFSGFITAYNTITPQKVGDVAYTVITAVDALRLLNNAQITTVADSGAGQLSGTRINKLLNQVSWPQSMRDIDAGQTTMQADPGTARSVLAACQTVQISEYGAFYVDASGSIIFQDRKFTTSSVYAPATSFNDNGTQIPYEYALWLLNDAQVVNYANITATGLATQNAQNASSITKYFTHGYTQQNLLMQTTQEALNYALAYVASHAETSIRCDAITLNLYTDNYDAGITAALGLDYFDPVTVTTTQPGSGTSTTSITKTLQVFGVEHKITPNSWRTTFTTLEPIIDGFIIGSSLYGVLGTNTLSY